MRVLESQRMLVWCAEYQIRVCTLSMNDAKNDKSFIWISTTTTTTTTTTTNTTLHVTSVAKKSNFWFWFLKVSTIFAPDYLQNFVISNFTKARNESMCESSRFLKTSKELYIHHQVRRSLYGSCYGDIY